MHHGRFFIGRLLITMLFIGLLFAVGSGVYRSGYREGFAQGAVLGAATEGGTVAPPAALYAGMMRPHPGSSLFPLLLVGFGLLFLAGKRRRRWHKHFACGPASDWNNGGGRQPRWSGGWDRPRRDPADEVGPEKQPEDFI